MYEIRKANKNMYTYIKLKKDESSMEKRTHKI